MRFFSYAEINFNQSQAYQPSKNLAKAISWLRMKPAPGRKN